jgi:hypothetical protein
MNSNLIFIVFLLLIQNLKLIKSFQEANNLLSHEIIINKYCLLFCDDKGGVCLNNMCKCKINYTTFLNSDDKKLCGYKKINKLVSGFLELIFGFGIGHFYCYRNINGSFKLMIYILLLCFACCSIALGIRLAHSHDQNEQHLNRSNPFIKCSQYILAFILSIIFFWQIYDFFMFIFGVYKDGNGVLLY